MLPMQHPLLARRLDGSRIRTLLSERSVTLLHRSSIRRRRVSFTLGGGNGGYEVIRQRLGHTGRHGIGKSMETRRTDEDKKMH
jgi:hypothetical protein